MGDLSDRELSRLVVAAMASVLRRSRIDLDKEFLVRLRLRRVGFDQEAIRDYAALAVAKARSDRKAGRRLRRLRSILRG